MAGKHSPALLDVNILIALFDSEHVHHDLAHDWFADRRRYGWATCAVTENGLVRVLSNPRYGIESHRPDMAIDGLKRFRASGHHVFWDDVVSLTDERLFNLAVVRGHAQLTDVYLLGLAHRNHGCLATFDRTIPLSAVKGAPAGALQVITPLD